MMKIGLLDEADLKSAQKDVIRAIEEYDLSPITARMKGKTADEISLAERELKRYFALHVIDPNQPHVIGQMADELWHAFLLDSKRYRSFCQRIFGRPIDHTPVMPDARSEWEAVCKTTKRKYARLFGVPEEQVFTANEMLCWGCGVED